jgi:RNA polymerase sigma-70 factor (ECF subfamily)
MEITQPLLEPVASDAATADDRLAAEAVADPQAFALLYQAHVDRVYRYLVARGSSEDDAEDLTAVTFERALRSIERYRPGGTGFLPWLLRIARNASIDAHRRRRGRAVVGLDGAAARVADTHPTPEQSAITAEERREILGLVARLPDVQRDALALRFAAGLTSREIAVVIGKSDAASKKLISRALAALREATRHDA